MIPIACKLKKQPVFQAYQVTGENMPAIADIFGHLLVDADCEPFILIPGTFGRARENDWIVASSEGPVQILTDNQFEEIYEVFSSTV